MIAHGAYRKGTDEYRMASSAVRGEHVCPECQKDVVLRRNKQTFYWIHRVQNEDCMYYAPEPECPQEFVRNHLIRVITKEYRRGNYAPRVEIKSSSLPHEDGHFSDDLLRAHAIPNVTRDPGDEVVLNYAHGSFVFDVAVLGANGTLKTATKIYDACSEPRDSSELPSDLEWIEYSSANL